MSLYLSELPGNTDGPAQSITSDEQGLHTPAPKMTECKDVKMAQDSLPGEDMTVHSVLLKHSSRKKAQFRAGVKRVGAGENKQTNKSTMTSASLLA